MTNFNILIDIIDKLRQLAQLDIEKAVKLVVHLLVSYSKIVQTILAIAEFVFEYLLGKKLEDLAVDYAA